MRTSNLRTVASAVAVLAAIVLGNTAEAQNVGPAELGLHVESAPRPFGRPAVEGYVYNEGLRLLSNVRLRVDVLDTDGTAVEEAFGWVFGDLTPRWSRILRRSGPESEGGPPSESPVV